MVLKTQINQLLLVVIVLNVVAIAGCHRSYYRRQADAEAQRLIREKSMDPRWDSADGTIDIDPMSRMFNPFSEDHPPIPPDDATSHQLMHNVDCREGYPHWHANGDTDYVEAPEWMSYLPMNEKGQVVLTLERAYELALLHSPDLQQQRERLYLSALDVSLERFGFDSQLFTGFNSFLTTQGRLRNGSGSSSTTLQHQIGANGGGLDLRRAGITGANFAVGLANTILFNFAGNNTQSATSLIDFSIIQPLLRGAGRDRIMESLTQTERDLLANVRQLERFRRGFYLQIAIGRNPGAGVSGNLLSTPGSASANAGGFFGLLQDQQEIRNLEFNVRQLEAVLEQFREFFMRERLDAIDLKLFENNVYGQQSGLLQRKNAYQTSLDQFKITLGLPPELDVVIDDSFLDRFELISDQINQRLITIGDLRRTTGSALNKVDSLFDATEEPEFDWTDFHWPADLSKTIDGLMPYIAEAETTLEKIMHEDRKLIEADLAKLESKREERLAYLKRLQESIKSGQVESSVSPELFKSDSIKEAGELRQLLNDPNVDELEFVMEDGEQVIPTRSIIKRAGLLKEELENVRTRIENFENASAQLKKTPDDGELDPELYDYILSEFQQTIPGLLSELNNLTLEMTLLQAMARSNSIEINDVSIDSEHAIRVARCMRRDWMNARAGLVDQWRNIEFVADQLEAQVDLVFQGDIGNTGDNPFKLRYETGQLRAGIRFDAPIVRMAERNNYRNALISYQQSRRNFYQFEDSIKRSLRQTLRTIDQNKVLFELNRRTVQVSIENVEISRYELEAPVGVNANARLGNTIQRNLTDSIRNLNNSQDRFLGSWVQLEVLRRNLDFDLGTMQLDELSRWIDPGTIDSSIGVRTAELMGVQLDCQFCNDINVSYSDTSMGSSVMDDHSDSSNQNEPNEYAPPEPKKRQQESPIEALESQPRSIDLNSPSPETSLFRQRRNQRLIESRETAPTRVMNPIIVTGKLSSKEKKSESKIALSNQGQPNSPAPVQVQQQIEKPQIVAQARTPRIDKQAFTQPASVTTQVESKATEVSTTVEPAKLKTELDPTPKEATQALAQSPKPTSEAMPITSEVVQASAIAPEIKSTKVENVEPTAVSQTSKDTTENAARDLRTAPASPKVDFQSLPKFRPPSPEMQTTNRAVEENRKFVQTKRISAAQIERSVPKLIASIPGSTQSENAGKSNFRATNMLETRGLRTSTLKPLPALGAPIQAPKKPSPPKEAFPWESDQKSFGGLLNRFKSTRGSK